MKSPLWAQRMMCGEYTSAAWIKAEKRSPHLVLCSRNHEYSTFMWKGQSYYQSMCLTFRYEDGKVLGTQPHPTRGLASNHCVLCLNLIKGMFNIVSYTHTHINMHLTINMASNVPKPKIHLSFLSTIKKTLACSYQKHLISYGIISW